MHTHCPHSCSSSCHGQHHGDRQYLRWPYPEWAALGFIRNDPKRRRKRNISLLPHWSLSQSGQRKTRLHLCVCPFFLFSFSKATFKIRALTIRGQPRSSLFTYHYIKHDNAVRALHCLTGSKRECFAAMKSANPASSLRGVLAPPRGEFSKIQLSVYSMKKGEHVQISPSIPRLRNT